MPKLKLLATASMLLGCLLSFAQKPVKTYYDPYQRAHVEESYFVNARGQKNGLYTKYDQNGLKRVEIPYLNGVPNGIAKEYYEYALGTPGQEALYKTATYTNGKQNGITIYYDYYDGAKRSLSGKRIKIGEEYYTNNVKTREITYYTSGKVNTDGYVVNGPQMKFYENGVKSLELHVNAEGVYDGEWREWWENGQLGVEGKRKDGHWVGERKNYNKNGKLTKDEFFEYGDGNGSLKVGLHTFYDSLGNKEQTIDYAQKNPVVEVFYSNGKTKEKYSLYEMEYHLNEGGTGFGSFQIIAKMGPYVSYYENGNLQSEGNYFSNITYTSQMNLRDGLWKFYKVDGLVDYENNYSQGKRFGKNRIFSDKDNKEVEDPLLADSYDDVYFSKDGRFDPTQPVTEYNKDGKKIFEGYLASWEPMVVNGKCTEFYENGNIKSSGNYDRDSREGAWIENYENGKLKAKGNYTYSCRTKSWEDYFEDGTIKMKSEYGQPVWKADAKNTPGSEMYREVPTGKWYYYDETGKLVKLVKYTLLGVKEITGDELLKIKD